MGVWKPIPLNRDQKNEQFEHKSVRMRPASNGCGLHPVDCIHSQPFSYPMRPASNGCDPHSYNWHDLHVTGPRSVGSTWVRPASNGCGPYPTKFPSSLVHFWDTWVRPHSMDTARIRWMRPASNQGSYQKTTKYWVYWMRPASIGCGPYPSDSACIHRMRPASKPTCTHFIPIFT